MTGEHDLLSVEPRDGLWFVSCRCGWRQQRTLEEAARDAHGRHRDLALHMPKVRAALEAGVNRSREDPSAP